MFSLEALTFPELVLPESVISLSSHHIDTFRSWASAAIRTDSCSLSGGTTCNS